MHPTSSSQLRHRASSVTADETDLAFRAPLDLELATPHTRRRARSGTRLTPNPSASSSSASTLRRRHRSLRRTAHARPSVRTMPDDYDDRRPPTRRTTAPSRSGSGCREQPLVDDRLSCFEAVTLKELEPMLVPEEPRAGVLDPTRVRPLPSPPSTRSGATTSGSCSVRVCPDRASRSSAASRRVDHCRLDDAPLDVLAAARAADAAAQHRGQVDPRRRPRPLRPLGRRQRALPPVGAGPARSG